MKKLIVKYNILRHPITVDGETQYVPSDRMLQEVFQTLPTIEDKERLCRNSNYFVKHIIPSTYSDISVVENLNIWGICCSILGHSFEQYYRNDIAMSWYTILESPSNLSRVAYDAFSWFSDALEPALNGKLIYGFESITKKVQRIEAPAFRFKGFQEAWTFHEETRCATKNYETTNSSNCKG
ncbi:MAG: hypothetical protein ACOYMQ_12985, partial [Pseudanabaena sp.]|jgi:hypothetical protein